MKFDKSFFDAGIPRVGTDSVKWDGMFDEHGDKSMTPMWVADMDFRSAPAIHDALAEVLARGTWGYTLSPAADTEALCGYWQRRHGVTISPECVVMSPCVITGMRAAIRTLTDPGDGVLINPPVYGHFFDSAELNGRKVVESTLLQGEDGRWNMDFADMEAKLAAGGVKVVMICQPHNPCGRAWTRAELETVVALCKKYGAKLISDEIHADFVFTTGGHTSILSIEGARDIAVMLCAASKTMNVAGLQQSAIVCENEAMRKAIADEMDRCGVKSGNCFALAATRAAYTDCDEWVDGLRAYLMDNRDFAMAFFKEHMPKIGVTPLDATYLMWLDCRALGLTMEQLMQRVFAAHVKLNDGLFFGEQGRGFLRMNIACPRSQLEEALNKLKDALN